MSRKIYAEIELDESVIDEDISPIDHFENEFGWLEQSGISLCNSIISDADDAVRWGRYIDYIINWGFEHYCECNEGKSLLSYNDWIKRCRNDSKRINQKVRNNASEL